MNGTELPTATAAQASARGARYPTLPIALGARVANLVLTSQVQMAYACATDARERAERAGACIQRAWPDTPLRRMVLDVYQAQASAADTVARNVLASARRRCGLAYAAY